MIDKLTEEIRAIYLDLEINKNKKLDLEIKLRELEESIKNQELEVRELEEERSFYKLVGMYNLYKDHNFPREIKSIVIERELFLYVSWGPLRVFEVSDITFGEYLKLWSTSWSFEGNPVIFSKLEGNLGSIKYWDLKTQSIKSVYQNLELDIGKYNSKNRTRKHGRIDKIIKYIQDSNF